MLSYPILKPQRPATLTQVEASYFQHSWWVLQGRGLCWLSSRWLGVGT